MANQAEQNLPYHAVAPLHVVAPQAQIATKTQDPLPNQIQETLIHVFTGGIVVDGSSKDKDNVIPLDQLQILPFPFKLPFPCYVVAPSQIQIGFKIRSADADFYDYHDDYGEPIPGTIRPAHTPITTVQLQALNTDPDYPYARLDVEFSPEHQPGLRNYFSYFDTYYKDGWGRTVAGGPTLDIGQMQQVAPFPFKKPICGVVFLCCQAKMADNEEKTYSGYSQFSPQTYCLDSILKTRTVK